MRTFNKHFFMAMLWLLPFVSTQANASGLFVQGGLHFGGDELASVSFVGGSNEEIDAGGLLSFTIGMDAALNESIGLRVGLGTKFDTVSAENGDVDFSRIVLDALLFYHVSEDWHLGAGFTHHSSVEFTGSGFASGLDVDFDDATGLLLALDYQLNERGYVGARLTQIDYTIPNVTGEASGNSIGVVIGYRFGH